jgi:hypothetical protein
MSLSDGKVEQIVPIRGDAFPLRYPAADSPAIGAPRRQPNRPVEKRKRAAGLGDPPLACGERPKLKSVILNRKRAR